MGKTNYCISAWAISGLTKIIKWQSLSVKKCWDEWLTRERFLFVKSREKMGNLDKNTAAKFQKVLKISAKRNFPQDS